MNYPKLTISVVKCPEVNIDPSAVQNLGKASHHWGQRQNSMWSYNSTTPLGTSPGDLF